jgi:PAS domain S-box-containing protein
MRRSTVMLELPKWAETLAEKEFMKYALERAEELTESEIGFMHFVNDEEASIELVAWSASTLEKYCTAAFDNHYPITEAGIWADAAREKRPIVINDYASAPNKHGLPAGHSALVRLLSIPVMEGGKVRMMTGVGNKAQNYSDYDVETVQLVGNETWRIVQRNRAEKSLYFASQVVNSSPVVCFRWAVTEGWPVIFVSENVAQWGYTAEDITAGRPPYADLVHPDDLPRVVDEVTRSTASGVAAYAQEYRILTQKNEVIWVADRTNVHRDEAGEPDFFDGVLTDITERKLQQIRLNETLEQQKILNKRLEDASNQLLQSEKMASIGQLAAGVAHELNNPIGFVHSNLGTLDGYLHDLMTIIAAYEKEADGTGKPVAAVRRIMEECDFNFLKEDIFSLLGESKDGLVRVRKIVQDLKSFSRVGEQEWQDADLHQGLDSTLNIVWNELKYKCKVVKEYGDIPHVYCMISQLNQVFMNLLVNAGHAIESQGTITIRSYRQGADQVCVEIGDTGKGIAPEHINRIFEPFFTTKAVGKGTGLGLSLSYGIVQRHGGRIEVDSQLGVGSTFRVLLPVRPVAAPKNQVSELLS